MEQIKESAIVITERQSGTPDHFEMIASLQLNWLTTLRKDASPDTREIAEQHLKRQIENWIYGEVRAAAQRAFEYAALSCLPSTASLHELERLFDPLLRAGLVGKWNCAHCGLHLRPLHRNSEILLHSFNGQRACGNSAETVAEWSEA